MGVWWRGSSTSSEQRYVSVRGIIPTELFRGRLIMRSGQGRNHHQRNDPLRPLLNMGSKGGSAILPALDWT